jgi:hypothetical protein
MEGNLLSSIQHYSRKKTIFVLPFSIAAIISIIVFGFCVIISPFKQVPSWLIGSSGIVMMLGIIIPLLALLLLEKQRNKLLNVDVMSYIDILADNPNFSNFTYYDLIDILLNVVREKYLLNTSKEQNYDIINILNKILFEDSKSGLANPFVYNRRSEFCDLCKFIQSNKNSGDELSLSNQIYEKYLNLKESKVSNKNQAKHTLLLKKLLINVKILLLVICIICYFFPAFNSWVFNFVAIILLLIEIINERGKIH